MDEEVVKKITPKSLDEIVVPVGKASITVEPEEVDAALEAAKDVVPGFQVELKDKEGKVLQEEVIPEKPKDSPDESPEEGKQGMEEIEICAAVDMAKEEKDIVEESVPTLKKLSQEELDALPLTKYGRDEYGRTLNKDGSVRKGRADRGKKRGSYTKRK